jgi:acetoin utilization deacetylase AcuC-like enzyme
MDFGVEPPSVHIDPKPNRQARRWKMSELTKTQRLVRSLRLRASLKNIPMLMADEVDYLRLEAADMLEFLEGSVHSNAHLIAAEPDMLEALYQCLGSLKALGAEAGYASEAARAAISKAKGINPDE